MSLSTLILRAWIRRMCARPSLSGNENSIRRSSRPGRNKAGSRVSGLHRSQSRKKRPRRCAHLLVAINTLMFPRGSNPSNWLMSSNIVRCTSLSPPAPSSKRAPPMASTSSKKIMHAFLLRAISNSSRIIRAPSPTYFWTSSEPITRMKVASVRLATARAQSVFPVPGGPNSKTPFGGSIPRLTKRSGWKEVRHES
jgi:hypothetical protein